VAIYGGSYGGYATLVGLTFTPEKFACGVDIVGPSNLVTLLSTIPPYWAPALQLFKDRVGDHTTEDGKKFLQERSPLTHVEKIKRPLLIAQGANDPRVKQAEADQIVKAMRDKKIPVTYVLFPDEGHGFCPADEQPGFRGGDGSVSGPAPGRSLRGHRRRLQGLRDHRADRRRRRAGPDRQAAAEVGTKARTCSTQARRPAAGKPAAGRRAWV